MPLLVVEHLSVHFGGVCALDGPSLTVEPGQICGLIGPNGAGKTTLFNCVSRVYRPRAGRIQYGEIDLLATPPFAVAALGIARTFQNLGLIPSLSIVENILVGGHTQSRGGFFASALHLAHVRTAERALRVRAHEIMERLDLLDVADERADAVPYGTMKRVELARALMIAPTLLLLDEPACGLNHSEINELAGLVLGLRDEYGVGVLLVEHHVAMVMEISDKVVVLDLGRKVAEGSAAQVQSDPAVIAAYLGGAA